LRIKEQEKRQTRQEHDDEDYDDISKNLPVDKLLKNKIQGDYFCSLEDKATFISIYKYDRK